MGPNFPSPLLRVGVVIEWRCNARSQEVTCILMAFAVRGHRKLRVFLWRCKARSQEVTCILMAFAVRGHRKLPVFLWSCSARSQQVTCILMKLQCEVTGSYLYFYDVAVRGHRKLLVFLWSCSARSQEVTCILMALQCEVSGSYLNAFLFFLIFLNSLFWQNGQTFCMLFLLIYRMWHMTVS